MSRLPAWAAFARKLPLLLLLLLPGACHLTQQAGPGTLEIVGDTSWATHDRLIVMLADGRGTDTLFDGKLLRMDTLARLPAGGYDGGQALFIIQGYRNGELAYEERRSYDGSRQQVLDVEIPFDRSRATASPSLDILPDQVRLFLGGAASPLEVRPAALAAGGSLVWKTGNPEVATVSQAGVLSPVGEGSTYVQAASGATLSDASAVRVVRDVPIVDAGAADTTVSAGSAVIFRATVIQEYGDVAVFAWDLDGDGISDDSTAGTAGQIRFSTPPRAFAAGQVKATFRVRDSEGNRGETSKLVRVSRSAPRIDSLGASRLVVSIKDTVAFAAMASGTGALLHSYAWDFDGDGADEATGILQGGKAPVAGAHAYASPDTYRARLRIEDVNAITATAEVTVTVKLDRPVADAGANRTAIAGTEVRLKGSDLDTLGRIVSREWKCGAAPFAAARDSGVHVFTAPSEAVTTQCVYRVTDDDGLAAEDTLQIVVDEATAPTLSSVTPADTTVSIRDSVAFAAAAAAGTADLKAYSLDVDGDGRAELQGPLAGRSGEIRIGRRFPSEGKFDATLKVEDQSGKTATRSVRVTVLLDPPKAGAGKDTTVEAGTRINLHGTASDSLGSVALTEWKIGNGAFVRVSGRDTSFTAPASAVTLVCVFRVTDDDGQTAEDIVEVTVTPPRIVTLSHLEVSTNNLDPDFSSETDTYAVAVPYASSSLLVTPTATDPGATVRVEGKTVARGATATVLLPAPGLKVVTILVIAQGDTTVRKPYTLMVNRAANDDANLSDLKASAGNLVFSPGTHTYDLFVTVSSIRLTPTARDPAATIEMTTLAGTARVQTGSPSLPVDLVEGPNTITLRVRAANGTTNILYTVNVTRNPADP